VHIIMNSSVHIERLLFKICSFNFADIHCLIIYKFKRSDVCISCPIIKGFFVLLKSLDLVFADLNYMKYFINSLLGSLPCL